MNSDMFIILDKFEKGEKYSITDTDRELIYNNISMLYIYYDSSKEFNKELLIQLLSKDNYATILRLINEFNNHTPKHIIKLKQMITIQNNFLNIFIKLFKNTNYFNKNFINSLILYALNNNILSFIFYTDKIDKYIIQNLDLKIHKKINIDSKNVDYYIKCFNKNSLFNFLNDDKFNQFISLLEGNASDKFKTFLYTKRDVLNLSYIFKE